MMKMDYSKAFELLDEKIEKQRKDIMIERDMLEGNINRMMVTHDHEELLTMFAYAHKRLGDLFWYNKKRINIEAVEEQTGENT